MFTRMRNQWDQGSIKPISEINSYRDYRAEFAPIAKMHRRFSCLQECSQLTAVAAMLTAWLIPSIREGMLVVALLFLVPFSVSALALPRLTCPACRQSLTRQRRAARKRRF